MAQKGNRPPAAADDPDGYVFQTPHVVYRGTDDHIHDLHWDNSGWHHSDLTTFGVPPALLKPAATILPSG